MIIQGTRGDGVRMVSFTEMELRARDEAIIQATIDWCQDTDYFDQLVYADRDIDFDRIITAAEQETPNGHSTH